MCNMKENKFYSIYLSDRASNCAEHQRLVDTVWTKRIPNPDGA